MQHEHATDGPHVAARREQVDVIVFLAVDDLDAVN